MAIGLSYCSGIDFNEFALRGSSIARKYLFLAALRLIQNDPFIARWYQKKLNPNAKMKMVTACMRKLVKALWHVARGAKFDAAKLVTL